MPLAPMMACTTEPPNPQTQSSSLLQRDVFAGITPAPHLNSGPLVRLHDVVRNFRKPIIRHIEVSRIDAAPYSPGGVDINKRVQAKSPLSGLPTLRRETFESPSLLPPPNFPNALHIKLSLTNTKALRRCVGACDGVRPLLPNVTDKERDDACKE